MFCSNIWAEDPTLSPCMFGTKRKKGLPPLPLARYVIIEHRTAPKSRCTIGYLASDVMYAIAVEVDSPPPHISFMMT